MIKIVKGRYGHRPNPKKPYVEVKTSKDKPFEASEEIEKSLVERGIAEYVATGENEPDAPVQPNGSNINGEDDSTNPPSDDNKDDSNSNESGNNEKSGENEDEHDLEKMSFKELQQLAKDYGLKATGTREELIEKINAIEAESEEPEAPNLNAEKPE